ncbi:MAG: divalent cation tolerance protein CutA [Candidatus Roizmanbacteria bacterium]|nr:divalent cation tolerance protein CutA [Candidatus Roizmanbacteria bacterium]
MKPCLLFLSCKNIKEADKISDKLLREKLIVCAKKISINSSYLWKNKIESAKEVLLIIDSVEENYEKINQEIKKLHSYKTYTLFMTNINKTNKETITWFKKEIIHTTASIG